MSDSVIIIIITRLPATNRINTQYMYINQFLWYSFTPSLLKIDEPPTLQLCHSWLGTL